MQDLPAFEDVLRELRPQAVLVWTEPLRQFLDRHCASLEGISLVRTGVIEMEALEAWEYRVGYGIRLNSGLSGQSYVSERTRTSCGL